MKNTHPGKFVLIEGLNGAGKTTQAQLLAKWLRDIGVVAECNHEPTTERFGYLIRKIIDRKPYIPLAYELRACVNGLLIKNVLARRLKYSGYPLKKSFLVLLKRTLEKLVNKVELTEEERQSIFIADRLYDIVLNITPKLRCGVSIIQDRYDISSYIHGMASGLPFNVLQRWHKLCLGRYYLVPDLVIYYWAPMDVAMSRNNQSGKIIDIYEKKIEFLKNIERAALELFHIPTLEPFLNKGVYCKGSLNIWDDNEVPYYWINAEGTKEEVFEITKDVIMNHFKMVN